jgi:hypothetical protein
MKINLKILTFFAFSTFVFVQAGEKIQNALAFCKNKANSALEFAKNNKAKTALKTAKYGYSAYVLWASKPSKNTLKHAFYVDVENEDAKDKGTQFRDAWLAIDHKNLFSTHPLTEMPLTKFNFLDWLSKKWPFGNNTNANAKIKAMEDRNFGPFKALQDASFRGLGLIALLAIHLIEKRIVAN